MKEIPLTQGAVAYVDDEDYERINAKNWSINPQGAGYAVRKGVRNLGEPRTVEMHREILSAPRGTIIDHINGNSLDNRKCNLRFCYTQKNAFNRKKPQVECTSRYKGVLRRKNTVSWTARIKYCETCIELGTYPTEEIAAAVYNLAAAIFFGEFRRENILDDSIKLSVFDTEKVMKRCHKAITTRRLNVKTERYTDYLASMRA